MNTPSSGKKETLFYNSKTLFFILVITAFVHISSLALSQGPLAGFRWEHLPVHASIEMLGAVIALWVAWTLISVNRSHDGTSFNLRIAAALITMGLLDGFHAIWYAGNEFVWLHSLATLFGGVAFASIFLNIKLPLSDYTIFTLFVAIAVIAGLWPFWAPDTIPKMTDNTGFTFAAKALNFSGGLLFVLAGLKLLSTYYKTRRVDDFLFFLHCILFGAAAIMFEHSKLWDFAWWGWHILRIMAYAVALAFIIQTEIRVQKTFISRLENEVEKQTKELTLANKRLERFASMASHDLKEPLRMISSFSQILADKLEHKLDETEKKHLQFVIDGSNHGLSLVDDILSLSRNSQGNFELHTVKLADIIEQVKNNNAQLIDDTSAEIQLLTPHVELSANTGQLYQLCTNIIANGLKYNNSTPPTISIDAKKQGEEWIVIFEDNGIGIDQKHFDEIFNEFSRLHSKEDYQGTGLGLATCLEIAKRNGGDIKVESEIAKGSTFTVRWPIKPVS